MYKNVKQNTGRYAGEPVSRDQVLWHERGQGNIYFPCSAVHEQDWQPYPVDPYSCYYILYINKYDPGAVHHGSPRAKLPHAEIRVGLPY